MMLSGVHPIFLLLATIGVVTGLFKLYALIPPLMPFIFAGSLIGALVRAAQVARRRDREPDKGIDYARLNSLELSSRLGWLKDNLRGHDEVVDRVVARLQQGLALAAPNRTLGSFLIVGPTGTGKTFLGELTAKCLYPESEPVILRMNQYKDATDVFTLIGPPPGYAGYEVGGALTRPVLENPYHVVVLDEFDKSHPDVRHCLYDILDTARCREKSSGRTVDFSACAFFATCNSGVDSLRAIWKEVADPIRRVGRAREALAREGFERPLLARFDDILLMDQLTAVEVAEVACLQLAKHWRQYGIQVTYASPELLIEAVKRNTEFQDYGVRQLAHLIREFTASSIEAARRDGATRVRLELGSSGQVTVARP